MRLFMLAIRKNTAHHSQDKRVEYIYTFQEAEHPWAYAYLFFFQMLPWKLPFKSILDTTEVSTHFILLNGTKGTGTISVIHELGIETFRDVKTPDNSVQLSPGVCPSQEGFWLSWIGYSIVSFSVRMPKKESADILHSTTQ